MGLLSGLLRKVNLGDLIADYLVSKATVAEMKRAQVGERVEMPTIRTKMLGGYWEIPMGPARRLE